MFSTILIAVSSLVVLLLIHELGHFVFAKKFGMKVEEFGIGIPPRIIGKKIKETIYSINLLPIGAFVRIKGENGESEDKDSFSQKPIWQRAIVLLAGVASFWVVAFLIFIFLFSTGVPGAISDDFEGKIIGESEVMLIEIQKDTPAYEAGLKMGDRVVSLENKERTEPRKVKDFIQFSEQNRGEEIVMEVKRGSEVFEKSVLIRESPPEGEGSIGVVLQRVGMLSYPWYQAPLKAIETCFVMTYQIIEGLSSVLVRVFRGGDVSAQIAGPVGIGGMISDQFSLGVNYFLNFIAIIALHLALFNILPIPALDGGRILFLGIEKLKGKPINPKTEQIVNGIFFLLLIGLMILVTVNDITKIL